jgi:hypothetical protein
MKTELAGTLALVSAIAMADGPRPKDAPQQTAPACEERVDVVVIRPIAAFLPSRSASSDRLYRVKFWQCGTLREVLVEVAGSSEPASPLELAPLVF